MMRRGFAIWKFARSAMTAVMLLNMQAVLRRALDALVSAWMRRTAAEAEHARSRNS
jgi:hypothetical protein